MHDLIISSTSPLSCLALAASSDSAYVHSNLLPCSRKNNKSRGRSNRHRLFSAPHEILVLKIRSEMDRMGSQPETTKLLKLAKLLKNRFAATESAKKLLGDIGLLSIAYSCSVLADKSKNGCISAEDVASVLDSLKCRQQRK